VIIFELNLITFFVLMFQQLASACLGRLKEAKLALESLAMFVTLSLSLDTVALGPCLAVVMASGMAMHNAKVRHEYIVKI
jgi:hypothetical protein